VISLLQNVVRSFLQLFSCETTELIINDGYSDVEEIEKKLITISCYFIYVLDTYKGICHKTMIDTMLVAKMI